VRSVRFPKTELK